MIEKLEKCPFCGSGKRPMAIPGYMCGTINLVRSKRCQEAQITNLQAAVDEADKIMERFLNPSKHGPKPFYDTF
jgi:hypothetical protein